jgi:dihydroorotate dehydrogenase
MSWKSAVLGAGYRGVMKPIFFQFDPEAVHDFMVGNGVLLGKTAPTRWLVEQAFSYQHQSLVKKIDGIEFPNPVGLAAGFDYNGQLTQVLPSVGFGFHTIGTVTLRPYEGNTPPRLTRFAKSKSILVNKGLKNLGAEVIIDRLKRETGGVFRIPTGVSIGATNQEYTSTEAQLKDIASCFKEFENSGLKLAYYEMNISCPNTFAGEPFTTPGRLDLLLRQLDKLNLRRLLYLKMPIDPTNEQFVGLLKVASRHNVQGVIIGNLQKNKKALDVHPEDRAQWQQLPGHLSGKPTFRRSNELIHLTRKLTKDRFTIIGLGGIFTPRDAQYKLEMGADLVQLITGMIFEGPQLVGEICEGLKKNVLIT